MSIRARRLWRRSLTGLTAFAISSAGVALTAGPAHAESVRAQQWYLDAWKIDEVWQISQGVGVTVAVVDSGVDATHPDLAGQIAAAPWGDGDILNHGTGIASLIAGTGVNAGGQGVYGVAPKSKIISYRVPEGFVPGSFDSLKMAEAVRAAADSDARIINLSTASSGTEKTLSEAVAYASSRGKLVVAGGGNLDVSGRGPIYPASYPGTVGVSAIEQDGRTWSGGNSGKWISLAAPGVALPQACTEDTRYCKGTGSSAATALVSGVAALVWSAHPDWTANQVIKRLIDNTVTAPGEAVPNDLVGYGIVSPRRALQASTAPGPADVNPLIGVRGDTPTSAPQPSPPATSAAPASPAPPPASAEPVNAAVPKGSSHTKTVGLAGIIAGSGTLLVFISWALRQRKLRRAAAPTTPPPPQYPPRSW